MIDVTDGTDVDVGLGTLKSSGQSTDSHLVAGEDMVDGVDGTRAQQGSPAGARQNVQGTGDARHLAIKNPKTIKNGDKQQEGRSMEDDERRVNSQIFRDWLLSHSWANQEPRIAEVSLSSGSRIHDARRIANWRSFRKYLVPSSLRFYICQSSALQERG